jgi:hypothetical protein
MTMSKRTAITAEAAESLAIQALTYLAAEPEQLGRFLAITGIGPERMRVVAREPNFLAGLLDYVASDEPLLIAFAAQAGIDPAEIGRACAVLGRQRWQRDAP